MVTHRQKHVADEPNNSTPNINIREPRNRRTCRNVLEITSKNNRYISMGDNNDYKLKDYYYNNYRTPY